MTTKAVLDMPREKNWDHYWSRDETVAFTRLSWSKRRIIRLLRPYLSPGQSALDAGCGSGFFAQLFDHCGLITTALDYSKEALAITRQKTQGRVRLLEQNLLTDRLSEFIYEPLDVIFTDGLLEHFTKEEQDQIVENLLTVLKPAGVLVTFVPNRFSPWELIRPLYMPGIKEAPFTYQQLLNLHRDHQLNILHSGGINTVPFALSPDAMFGSTFGMLLFVMATQKHP